MFSFFARGRSAPRHVVTTTDQGPIRLDEARLAAWALALGETGPPPTSPSRAAGRIAACCRTSTGRTPCRYRDARC